MCLCVLQEISISEFTKVTAEDDKGWDSNIDCQCTLSWEWDASFHPAWGWALVWNIEILVKDKIFIACFTTLLLLSREREIERWLGADARLCSQWCSAWLSDSISTMCEWWTIREANGGPGGVIYIYFDVFTRGGEWNMKIYICDTQDCMMYEYRY